MSERVNRVLFYLKDGKTRADVIQAASKQIDLLLESGYNCFITEFKNEKPAVCIEFCLADPEAKDREIPQPCWLFLDELEYLGRYQLQEILREAQETVSSIKDEIEEEDQEETKSTKKKKKHEYDA